MPLLPHSWSQTKAKTQWQRPNCNLLVLGRASQLSEQVSSSALHWTLSERRLTKHSSFNGQLSLETFGPESGLKHRVNTNKKNGPRRMCGDTLDTVRSILKNNTAKKPFKTCLFLIKAHSTSFITTPFWKLYIYSPMLHFRPKKCVDTFANKHPLVLTTGRLTTSLPCISVAMLWEKQICH